MYVDIVFPNNNEKDFLSTCSALEIKGICFVYDYQPNNISKIQQRIMELNKKSDMQIYLGLLVKPKQASKARKLADLVIVKSSTQNREAFEKYKPDIIYNLESDKRSDKVHYKRAGLNQVLCKLANKNKIMIGFSFSDILNNKSKERIGRINQNVKYCRKYNVDLLLASFAYNKWEMRSENDIKSVAVMLGMNTLESKNVVNNTHNKIKDNIDYKKGNKIIDGITLTSRDN